MIIIKNRTEKKDEKEEKEEKVIACTDKRKEERRTILIGVRRENEHTAKQQRNCRKMKKTN